MLFQFVIVVGCPTHFHQTSKFAAQRRSHIVSGNHDLRIDMGFDIAFVELSAGCLLDRAPMKKKSLFVSIGRGTAVKSNPEKIERSPARHLHFPVVHQEFDAVHGR